MDIIEEDNKQLNTNYNSLYTPDIKPHRHYETDAEFIYQQQVLPPPEIIIPERTPKHIQEELEEIEDIIYTSSPPEIHFVAKTIKKVTEMLDVEFPNGENPKKPTPYIRPEKTTPVPEHERANFYVPSIIQSINENIELPEVFPSSSNVTINVQVPRSLVEIMSSQYQKDMIDLSQKYLDSLQMVFQRYFNQMLILMANLGIDSVETLSKDFDGDVVKIPPNQNLEHCRDYIVRSQVIRKQKANLFRKTHKVDNTLRYMRAWHAAAQQRERYFREEYGDSSEYITSHSNAILRESRSTYNANYKNALYNMYKFLNSSVKITDDILTMNLKEAQAKGKLIMHGVNVFATADTIESQSPVIESTPLSSSQQETSTTEDSATTTTTTEGTNKK